MAAPPATLLELLAGRPAAEVIDLMAGWLSLAAAAGKAIPIDPASGEMLLVVRRGALTVVEANEGDGESAVRTCGPGALLGNLPDYGYSLAGATVTAAADTELLILSRVMVEQLRRRYPEVASRWRQPSPQ